MKTVIFSEAIAASDPKVSRSRHLVEYMKVYEYDPGVTLTYFTARSNLVT